ncbi:hypothetical protein D3H35_02690 [Cohnella faecalis]|uniref:Uncharacterized protein n=1 Tax=Cohnella faecalis TaxID=2315694 RepID=A0A398CNW0_9BACL|nr:hypothetical protein D3H35_02690 [Cohnella faecalis]
MRNRIDSLFVRAGKLTRWGCSDHSAGTLRLSIEADNRKTKRSGRPGVQYSDKMLDRFDEWESPRPETAAGGRNL